MSTNSVGASYTELQCLTAADAMARMEGKADLSVLEQGTFDYQKGIHEACEAVKARAQAAAENLARKVVEQTTPPSADASESLTSENQVWYLGLGTALAVGFGIVVCCCRSRKSATPHSPQSGQSSRASDAASSASRGRTMKRQSPWKRGSTPNPTPSAQAPERSRSPSRVEESGVASSASDSESSSSQEARDGIAALKTPSNKASPTPPALSFSPSAKRRGASPKAKPSAHLKPLRVMSRANRGGGPKMFSPTEERAKAGDKHAQVATARKAAMTEPRKRRRHKS